MYGRIQDLAALIGRVGIAVVFLAYGIDKWDAGVSATAEMMEGSGVPLPTAAAVFVMIVEVVGSIAFIIGLFLPLVGIGYAVIGLGAIYYVQLDAGLVDGYALELVLALAGLAIAFNGGRLSIDHLVFGRIRANRKARKQSGAHAAATDEATGEAEPPQT